MNSTRVNFRIPTQLKRQAQLKAESMGIGLSGIVKLFLEKFTQEDVLTVSVKQDIKREKIFDEGVISHLMSKKGKETTRAINALLAEI